MREIQTDNAPVTEAPLSQGIVSGNTIYVSGQVPIDPETGEMVGDDAGEQTIRTLENVAAVLEAAGTSIDDVVKTTVFLADVDDFSAVNAAYAEFMSEPLPARSAIQVGELAVDAAIEIEAIAEV